MVALALLVSVPMQLAAAAGVELATGYDSTVFNQRELNFGNGLLTRAAADTQIAYRGDRVRHLLRVRGEYWYTTNEGRSAYAGDYLALARYAGSFEASEDWIFNWEGSFSIGAPGLLLGRTNASDRMFLQSIYGEYTARLSVHHNFSERLHAGLSLGSLGRGRVRAQEITCPFGLPTNTVCYEPRQNNLGFNGQLELGYDLSERNVGLLSLRGEGYNLDGIPTWVPRLTASVGLRRTWNEDTATTLSVGVDALRDQNDPEEWFVGPYVNAGVTRAFPAQNLVTGLSLRYEYAIVAAARCNIQVTNNASCPPEQVVAGGTGRVLGADFSGVWRPGDGQWSIFSEVSADYGTTRNRELLADGSVGPREVDVGNLNLSAAVGARRAFTRSFSVFARYNFIYNYLTEPVLFGALSNFVRHVAMVGVIIAASSESDVLEPLVPYEEAQATHGAWAAAGERESTTSASSGSGRGANDPDPLADPFDMSFTEAEASQVLEGGGSNDTQEGEGDAEGNNAAGRVRPGSTRGATQRATQNSTRPSTRSATPRPGAPAGSTSTTPEGTDEPAANTNPDAGVPPTPSQPPPNPAQPPPTAVGGDAGVDAGVDAGQGARSP